MLTLQRWLAGIVLVVGLSAVAVAQNQTAPALTNADIVRMVKAQLATGLIANTIDSTDINFDMSPDGLIALKQAGVSDQLIQYMQTKIRDRKVGASPDGVSRTASEKSDLLASSKDPNYILRNFKTMLVS